MARRGEKFPEEMVAQSKESPGPVRDDEWLERRLPPYEGRRHAEAVPTSAFRRGHLTWDEEKGGLSVQRSEYTKGGVRGEQGMRATASAVAEEIRNITNAKGERVYSVTDDVERGGRSHASIQREPRGEAPTEEERDALMGAWCTAPELLRRERAGDPEGHPEIEEVPETGVVITWVAGRSKTRKQLAQVESLPEAATAYCRAGLGVENDMEKTLCQLQEAVTVTRNLRARGQS